MDWIWLEKWFSVAMWVPHSKLTFLFFFLCFVIWSLTLVYSVCSVCKCLHFLWIVLTFMVFYFWHDNNGTFWFVTLKWLCLVLVQLFQLLLRGCVCVCEKDSLFDNWTNDIEIDKNNALIILIIRWKWIALFIIHLVR